MSSSNANAVFYADAYHPIQAGSIDGTDILPHDNAVYRAVLCSSAGLCEWAQFAPSSSLFSQISVLSLARIRLVDIFDIFR